MKNIFKNIPILGFLLRWFYNLLHLNNLKFIVFSQQAQINDLASQTQTLLSHNHAQQAQINDLTSQTQTLFGHNHVHHENYKKIQETIKQQVGRQISYHSILFHQKINQFIEEIKIPTKIEEGLIQSFVLDDYYLNFEETFRGSREVISQRYMEYLKFLNPSIKKSLDIGCGRGEWVEILQQNNIDAYGIDLNFAMLNSAKSYNIKNLQKIDAFEFFKTCPDNTFDLVCAFHVIEHIPFEKLFMFLQEIKRITTPNGLILLETPNPANLLVGACTFYKDPTHLNPLPSEVVEFMLSYMGFINIQIHFLHPYPAKEHIAEDSECALRLNNYFYGAQDYLISATNFKPSTLPTQPAPPNNNKTNPTQSQKPKLAYVSPFPPLKTGIASYSASLITYLSEYYDIELILSSENINAISHFSHFPIYPDDWFMNNHHLYERIIYHFGNSSFHTYMIDLLASIPGIVVLHDFYLNGAMSKEHIIKTNDLYRLHGYRALIDLQQTSIKDVQWKYPCNKEVLKNALSIISHSKYLEKLASDWYNDISSLDFYTIPLLKSPISSQTLFDKKTLNLPEDAFVVCSFGIVGESKKTQSIIDAWLKTPLSKEPHCYLIFVGEGDATQYTKDVEKTIESYNNIYITGWTDEQTFSSYLSIADVAIQLRTLSRGETSAALLDCLNYGIPTIANANGSIAEFPNDILCMLEDKFEIEHLAEAIELLYNDKQKRQILSQKAKEYIQTFHNPKNCATQYAKAIEKTYSSIQPRAKEINNIQKATQLANFDIFRQKQILIDVSSISKNDLKTGIERVVRSNIHHLIDISPLNYRIEPVYFANIDGEYSYFYARLYTANLLKIENFTLPDEPISLNKGDIFYGADLCVAEVENAVTLGLYEDYKNIGAKIIFTVYDLLPILHPNFFPPHMQKIHSKWLENISNSADALISISQTVSNELFDYLQKNHFQIPKIFFVHLGSDISPLANIQNNSNNPKTSRFSFLMVGTIEPRKGHFQTIKAFEILWGQNFDIELHIVGKKGWMVDEVYEYLTTHKTLNEKLFVYDFVLDEDLMALYAKSSALIMASEAEGFGLPLIEAAKYSLPIIARDIPIFHEIAQNYPFYFENSTNPTILADAIKQWLSLYQQNTTPNSSSMPYITWEQNAQKLLNIFSSL